MEANRRKKARLAIDAMIRGLELDQVSFAYDEGAMLETLDGRASHRSPAPPEIFRESQPQP